MSKEIKYWKWIGDIKTPEFNAIYREDNHSFLNVTYAGVVYKDTFKKTDYHVENNPAYWQPISYSEFRKLKAELVKKGKKNV